MRLSTPCLTLAGIAALLLVACGGGGGGSGSSSGGNTPNTPPTANAGPAQTVTSGTSVTLNGAASSDAGGSIASYSWTQTAGNAVVLSSATASQPMLTAPTVANATTLTFSLVVTDNLGAVSTAALVNITVNPPTNIAPTANAGTFLTVISGATVTLNGTASRDSDGSIVSYAWTQTEGPAVTLSSATAAMPSFTAPTVATGTLLRFSLVVTDNRGATSAASTANVAVNAVLAGNAAVTGTVTFARVLIATAVQDPVNRGLRYGDPVQQPSRGVVVRALDAANQTIELATAVTDSVGNYSMSVPSGTSIVIEVVARMLHQSPPNWDIRVQNGISGNVPYTYTDSVAFSSSAGTPHNVAIPTGISASGTATGQRGSGPLAILDTLYQGVQTILSVAPSTDFPELIVNWGPQSAGTFFTGGPPQHIELLWTLGADTDEFDQHVIAHEFGHYIEENYSRADSIGGSHSFGEKLDPRVAFGEGFGYAFAAIVLNSTDARDSSTNNGVPFSTGFDIEENPQTSPVGAPGDDYGCWCSETSVYSILWDLYDSAADANDTVSLGFAPLWNVLIDAQKTTPAFTTIFPFITALKTAQPAAASAIDALVLAQNINGTDAYGAGETHVPTSIPNNAALPLYTTIPGAGGSVVLRTVDDGGRGNKLGNHRFVRFTPSTSRSVTVTLATTSADNDPDFRMRRPGQFELLEDDPPPGPETGLVPVTAGTTYVLDIYDCANGCGSLQGTSGDYDLTVTIN